MAAGSAITVCTAGLGVAVFFAGNIAAGALIGGAIQGAFRVVSYDSIENGVTVKNYAKSFAIGATIGAVGGGTCAGITAGIMGLEATAASIAEAGVGELVGNGAATGATNGALSSISNDIDSVIVDGESKCLGVVVKNVLKGTAIGSVFGMIFSGIAKAEAKARIAGKTKFEAIEEKMSVASEFMQNVAAPMSQSFWNSMNRYF